MADDLANTGGDAPSTSPVEQGVKDAALAALARPEDISGYAAERQAREAEAKGEEVNTEQRAERITKALAEAREATEKARQENGLDQPPDLDRAYEAAEARWREEQQQEATFEAERQAARDEGRFMAVAENLKARDPQTWQTITDHLGELDTMIVPEQAAAMRKALTNGNPQESLAIVHRLTQTAYNPDGSVQMTPQDKLAHLASLPPAQLADTIDQARMYLQIENQVGRQMAARYAAAPRRHTQAPPVFSRPRGAAMPPQNLDNLARKSENISDYVRMRQQQMKRENDR
jgi:hypothetical protein